MLEATGKNRTPLIAGATIRVVVTALFVWTSAIFPVLAETAKTPDATKAPEPAQTSPQPVYSMSDLEYLLGPIALFPDTLLALVLPAATFPENVNSADVWIAENPEAVKKDDFSQVDGKDWDSSVKALTRFPDVIAMMAAHLDWTQSLGTAFALQPDDVNVAIQLLRAKAEKLGNLKSTPEQVVTVREEASERVIYIAPSNPERIYVPVYDTSTIFTTALPAALLFGTGVFVGSYWNSRWGWNNRRWNTVWIERPIYHPPPPNWRPPVRPDRPNLRPPGEPWRPDRPGNRPDRPTLRPDRPGGVRPDRPNRPERPERPNVRPERPNRPNVRPERPNVRPDRPNVRPDRPSTRPQRPSTRPNRPSTRPQQRPNTRPQQRPSTRPQQRPNVRPEQRPSTRPQQRPSARPEQRPSARPQQRPSARPGNAQRPQQRPARQNQRKRPPIPAN